MTNDVPNEGWTSLSVLRRRRDFNYSSVCLPARPSVKTWTGVNYSDDDDMQSPYRAVYLVTGPASKWHIFKGHYNIHQKVREKDGVNRETKDQPLIMLDYQRVL